MSKKRTSTESDNDKQAIESSGSLLQNDDNAKRARLDSPSDTTLQDLPIELLELILIKAVVMEVKGLKLAKCAWKEKADPVIGRLKQVCLQWSNVLTPDHFRTEVYRTLDDTAQDSIRLEVLQELSVNPEIHAVTTLKDEIFTLRKVGDQCHAIDVYDRDNMEVVKDVITLPKSYVRRMIYGNASNCLYVGLQTDDSAYTNLSVLRIRRDAQHQFNQSSWEHAHGRSIYMFSISANGGLLTFSQGGRDDPDTVTVHDANDSLQLEVVLPRYDGDIRHMGLLQKSNGNLVLSYVEDRKRRTQLLEIATTGSIVRQYESSLSPFTRVNFADDYGRIVITDSLESGRMELLDSEFNLLGKYRLKQDKGKSYYIYDLKYDNERSVIMRIHHDWQSNINVLTTFRFTEECMPIYHSEGITKGTTQNICPT